MTNLHDLNELHAALSGIRNALIELLGKLEIIESIVQAEAVELSMEPLAQPWNPQHYVLDRPSDGHLNA